MSVFKWLCLFILLTPMGCTSIGPRKIHSDWGPYNDVVVKTENEQLLKNIVRIRYAHSVYFLKLSNITASYNINPSISAAPSITSVVARNASSISKTIAVTPEVSYSETPTITYVPLSNSQFIHKLLTPTKISELSFLFYGGIHPINTLLRLAVTSMNDLDNASSITALLPSSRPVYQRYYQLLTIVEALIDEGKLKVYPAQIGEQSVLVLHFTNSHVARSSAAHEIRRLLKLPQNGHDIYLIEPNFNPLPQVVGPEYQKDVAYIQTRSIIGILNYLSHGVCVPYLDIKNHYALDYEYNWDALVQNIIRIVASDREPLNAYVKTYVHGHWFYIADDDLTSKVTFDFVTRLLTLTASQFDPDIRNSGPLLTIPADAHGH